MSDNNDGERLNSFDVARQVDRLRLRSQSAVISVELDGREYAIERVCMVEDTGDILIVCTPDPLTE